jgi:LmbE family N-acetylglucosaminyl deacetylase
VATVLAVSPHLDDAVLSYGGRLAALARQGHDVQVFTMFAGTPRPPYSPAALAYHQQWELDGDPVAPRREEDRRALAVLGATPRHGGQLDAIYRRAEHGGWLIQDGEPTGHTGDEPALVGDLTATIRALLREGRPDRVLTCAAVGHHVDHRRARDATLAAAGDTGVPVVVWDDFPYATWASEVPTLPAGWVLGDPVAEPIAEPDFAAWTAATRCYESQLAMLESDGIPLPRWFAEHCASQVDRLGAHGIFHVTRPVVPVAARREARRVGAADLRRHPDLQPQ